MKQFSAVPSNNNTQTTTIYEQQVLQLNYCSTGCKYILRIGSRKIERRARDLIKMYKFKNWNKNSSKIGPSTH